MSVKTIQDVKVGLSLNHPKYGKGMVTKKTARTITAVFENGTTVKNTYKTKDARFWPTDF